MTDRAVPFTLSIKVSQLARIERVLTAACAQGRLKGDPHRPNKLAAELLLQAVADLETLCDPQGLLAAPAAPAPPAFHPPPHPDPFLPLPSPASDPAYRAQIRAAHDARAARLAGAPLPAATLPELEAAYRAAMAPDSLSSAPLPVPEGIDWDRTP
jgi:hypothetical protein